MNQIIVLNNQIIFWLNQKKFQLKMKNFYYNKNNNDSNGEENLIALLQKNSNQNSAFKDTKTKNNEYSIKKNYDNNESNLNNNNFNNIDEKDIIIISMIYK